MSSIGVAQLGTVAPGDIAARSCAALDRPLAYDAELVVARSSGDAVLLGAFQRATEVDTQLPIFRRGSGGAAARVGEGTLWVSLALERPSALVACEPTKIVNRYVRPLLRTIAKLGAPARYFGRDWISVAHRPTALVGFAHDTETGRAVFEAFVPITTRVALGPRSSFTGKEQATLEELLHKPVDVELFAQAIEAAYASAYAREVASIADVASAKDAITPGVDPPWTATRAEAIGIVAAGRDAKGRIKVGGEILASRDAIGALEARANDLAPNASREGIAFVVNETLAATGVAVDGVRALTSIVDVIGRALRA